MRFYWYLLGWCLLNRKRQRYNQSTRLWNLELDNSPKTVRNLVHNLRRIYAGIKPVYVPYTDNSLLVLKMQRFTHCDLDIWVVLWTCDLKWTSIIFLKYTLRTLCGQWSMKQLSERYRSFGWIAQAFSAFAVMSWYTYSPPSSLNIEHLLFSHDVYNPTWPQSLRTAARNSKTWETKVCELRGIEGWKICEFIFRFKTEEKIQYLHFLIKKIKSVAYSCQGNHTGQLDFCNWLADGSTTG